MPFLAGWERLAVRAVKGAVLAFIGAKRRPLTEGAGGPGARFQQEGQKKRIYARYMLRICVIAAIGALGLTLVSGLAAERYYIVGANVQVSVSEGNLQHYETQIDADPERSGHLIACAYVWLGKSSENVFYVSFDHGKTWRHTLTVENSTDPSCKIGIAGVAFAGSIHDDASGNSFLDVRRSADRGRTWQQSEIQSNTVGFDRDYLTVDHSHGPFRGRVYVDGYIAGRKDPAGSRLPAAFAFLDSENRGRTFEHLILRQACDFAQPWFFPANGVVTNQGSFLALFVELDNSGRNMSYKTDAASAPKRINGALKVVCSRDGGRTLTPAVKIGDAFYDWRAPQLSMSSLAVDQTKGPFRGRLYAAWPGAGPEPYTQIFLGYSKDNGRTWSKPRVISDSTTILSSGEHPNSFMPVVAVNKNGVVGICWYDRRDNPDNLGYWERFSASMDGGVTWLPSVRVSTNANLVNPAEHDTRFNGGDTAGLTADADGIFHALWIDNRTGVHQMWTASINVRR